MSTDSGAPIRVMVVDDHPIVLDGFEHLFRQEPGLELAGRARDLGEARRLLVETAPDILLLDLKLPGGDGLELLRGRERVDRPRVVLMTASIDDDQLLEALRLGVAGVILKESASESVIEAIRTVHAGDQWLDRTIGVRATRRLLGEETARRELAELLTNREQEIVREVAAGKRNRAIAESLHITEGTVKLHLHNIYRKLGVSGRLELALRARSGGFGRGGAAEPR